MKKLISLFICLSVILTMSLTLLSCADNSGANGTQNDASTSDKNDDPVLTPEAMKIEDRYVVISEDSFKIKVTEDEKTTLCNARVATLKNDNGEHATYIDVLDDELKVKVFKIYRGRTVVELVGDDMLAIMNVNILPDKQLVMFTDFVRVTDHRPNLDGSYDDVENVSFYSAYDGVGATLIDHVMNSFMIMRLETDVIAYFHETITEFSMLRSLKPTSTCVLLADSYSEADKAITYSDTEKTASLFENEDFVRTKLNFDYVLSLYSISR